MQLNVGDTVGDYEILGVLGRGGMGKVYRVRNVISDRVEAMKVVLSDLADKPEVADRFAREIKLHASLIHPNIAALHTALRHSNAYLMVMEFVEGQSLDQLIRRGRMEAGACADVVWQVLAALAYAHHKGVIHRDVKPANILVTPSGQVKVTDFGIARSGRTPHLTASGSIMGSIFYMSPEQINTLPLDGRSDLYSVGVTSYELLTGRRPIEGNGEFEILKAHLEMVPPAPASLVPDLPPELSAVVMRALAKNPDHRFQSAAEFQAALRPFRVAHIHTQTAAYASVPTPVIRGPVDTFSTPLIPAAELSGIQTKLAIRLGPLANRLVTKAAKQFSKRDDLVREVAKYIDNTQQREAFLRECGCTSGSPRRTTDQPVMGQYAWDPEIIKKVKQNLSRYIGPIASVLVDRTAKRVTSVEQLYRALAEEIPSEQDRVAFLRGSVS